MLRCARDVVDEALDTHQLFRLCWSVRGRRAEFGDLGVALNCSIGNTFRGLGEQPRTCCLPKDGRGRGEQGLEKKQDKKKEGDFV